MIQCWHRLERKDWMLVRSMVQYDVVQMIEQEPGKSLVTTRVITK